MMRNETWMKTISDIVIVIFSNAIMKVTQSQLCLSSFSRIMKRIGNSILKGTLQLKILRTWKNKRSNSFIKTSENMKRKSKKVPGTQ